MKDAKKSLISKEKFYYITQVCDGTNKTFVILNQKGIDPICLENFANDGIMALRRAKKRNGERLSLACGGN